jgi:hypothetical protein
MTKLIFTAALLFLSVICNSQSAEALPPKDFFSCWKASYEENNEKTKSEVYRPCSYEKFRPSMFRLEIEFFKTGKCKYLHVGAADLHYYIEGKWTYNKKTNIITVLDDKEIIAYKFKLKKVNKEFMKVISLN